MLIKNTFSLFFLIFCCICNVKRSKANVWYQDKASVCRVAAVAAQQSNKEACAYAKSSYIGKNRWPVALCNSQC
ncbi:hypothetical protein [Candidatus Cardinium hertigii]|uniref:hypothetical protein n=1 Tax=Candidatus Cardinium hertigii TaxID=247481 RepID=UPI0013A53B40|nr:hypothetical protein [Candidatus Cardinium hertigii]